MRTRLVTGLATAGLALAALAGAWAFLAPVQAGGGTSYAIVVGNSMEPKLHRGDLAVVRRSDEYRPGDVVLYDSRELGSKVLHRIVRVEDGRFVLQGDSNDFLDPERPSAEQIVGKLWVSVPAVGRASAWLREPWHGALVVGLVTLLALGGGAGAAAAVRRPTSRSHRALPPEAARAPLLVAAAALALCGLALLAFTRPTTAERSVEAAYAHQGRFAYEARVPRSPVYTDGHVATGEPVFLRLVPHVRVSFAYALETELDAAARGTIALDARISDGRGWERVLPLAAERSFTGRAVSVQGVLDLRRLERLVGQVRELTGSPQPTFTVAVEPRVAVGGRVGRDELETTFAPALLFELDDLRLQPSLDGEGVGPLAPRETGSGTAVVPATLSLGRISLEVAAARRVALAGLALALLAAGVALVARRRGGGDDGSRRYEHLIVPVASRRVEERTVTDLESLDALARVAEHAGRLILRLEDGRGRAYLVEDGGSVYRYRTEAAMPPVWELPRIGHDRAAQ
jgi:signal peptidase I